MSIHKIASDFFGQLPLHGSGEALSQEQPSSDFNTDSVIADFKACMQEDGATLNGCALFAVGGGLLVRWHKQHAAQLAKTGRFGEAGEFLFIKGNVVSSRKNFAAAVELYGAAVEYFDKAKDKDRWKEARFEFARASNLLAEKLAQKDDLKGAVRHYEAAARGYSGIGEYARVGVLYAHFLIPLYEKMESPSRAAQAVEDAARNSAKAGYFGETTVAANQFKEAAERRKNTMPDILEAADFMPWHPFIALSIRESINVGDTASIAQERLILAKAILGDYERIPNKADVRKTFLDHVTYQYRKAAEEYFSASRYSESVGALSELVDVLAKHGEWADFAGLASFDAIQRAREIINHGLIMLGREKGGDTAAELRKSKVAFDAKYAQTPDRFKKFRADAVAENYIAAAELSISPDSTAGFRVEQLFRAAEDVYLSLGLRDDAAFVKDLAGKATGIFGYEHVRAKWGDGLAPMTQANLKIRVKRLSYLVLSGIDSLATLERIYDQIVEYANRAIIMSETGVWVDSTWFEIQKYNAMRSKAMILEASGRSAEEERLRAEMEEMRESLLSSDKYRDSGREFEVMLRDNAAPGIQLTEFTLSIVQANEAETRAKQVMSKVVPEIRKMIDEAYRLFKESSLAKAIERFEEIAEIAGRTKGLEAIKAAALVAKGDIHSIEGGENPTKRGDAYLRARMIAERGADPSISAMIIALGEEALDDGGKETIRDIWNEMHPKEWLFTSPLSELEGGVITRPGEPAVLPPEIERVEGAIGRAEALRTRDKFLEAFRAAERARKSAAEMAKKK